MSSAPAVDPRQQILEAERNAHSSAGDSLSKDGLVFVGTRVPLRNLIDSLERGHSLDEFLDAFPSVTREQAIAALEAAHEVLAARAHSPR
jgi:uncharacterized protein (DUF433 family)